MAEPVMALVAEDVHKSFGALEVLKGVSLSARDGDVISIIGSSGSGKSTFLRCINFLETPDRGRIVVGGEEVRVRTDRNGRSIGADQAQIDHLRTRLGMVFQSFNLWSHMTVLQNVMEGPVHVLKWPRAEAREKAMALLENVGIAEKLDAYPSELSGGQQQRVAVARAVIGKPDLILADEPTGNLDTTNGNEVMNILTDLNQQGTTILMVTHSLAHAAYARRDISLFDGEIITEQARKAL